MTTFARRITATTNDLVQRLRDSHGVIPKAKNYRTWLEGGRFVRAAAAGAPVEMLQSCPVSTRVNTPKNDGHDLLAPAR